MGRRKKKVRFEPRQSDISLKEEDDLVESQNSLLNYDEILSQKDEDSPKRVEKVPKMSKPKGILKAKQKFSILKKRRRRKASSSSFSDREIDSL